MNYSDQFIEHADFDTMNDPERQKLLEAATDFANALANKQQPHSLAMLGDAGIGKTHLAQKLYEWAKLRAGTAFDRRWPSIAYVTAQNACGRFLDGQYDLPELMKKEDFLVIDDLGTEHDPRQTFRTQLQAVMDRRLGKWTVVTSNLSFSQLSEYDARLASRTIRNGGKVVHSRATDFNLELMRKEMK